MSSVSEGTPQALHESLGTTLSGKHHECGFSSFELLVVVVIVLMVGALATPVVVSTVRGLRIAGDAHSIAGEIGIAKMRAAADFTHSRVYLDTSANTYGLQRWRKSVNSWVTEDGPYPLSANVSAGFGALNNPPTGTQANLAQAPACLNNAGGTITNTACIVFNSRGISVDSTGAPTTNGALYITDGTSVYGVTVSATGLIQAWRSSAMSAGWSKQ